MKKNHVLIEIYFAAYKSNGANIAATLRDLAKEGLKISRPTFTLMIKKHDFNGRLSAAPPVKEKNETGWPLDDVLLSNLIEQKEKYEAYFKTIGLRIDNQAQFAYSNLITSITNLRAKKPPDMAEFFLLVFRGIINYLSENDKAAAAVLERNFDGIVEFARQKYSTGEKHGR